MTLQTEVMNDEKYVTLHNAGFVGLDSVMGSDTAIVRAARVSYGAGTKTINDDISLLRYLMRHKHTTPFEVGGQLKFHAKVPLFVMNQWIRHRSGSFNVYSGRYSIMTDEFYVPSMEYVRKQSSVNKQGSGEIIDETVSHSILDMMKSVNAEAYGIYNKLLECELSRELSRIILPLSNYTEFYWLVNLHNLFHFLTLRADKHAQQEIQDYANAIVELARPNFPNAFDAWEDYIRNGVTFSQEEMIVMNFLINGLRSRDNVLDLAFENLKNEFGIDFRMGKREWAEFKEKI